jgi:hypothetical protein
LELSFSNFLQFEVKDVQKAYSIFKTARVLARGQKPWKEGSKDLLTVGH